MSYNDHERAQLKQALLANGVLPERASQVVDLAIHASDQAMETLSAVVKSAPDFGICIMAFEIALQLAKARMSATFDRIHEYGRQQGVPQYMAAVDIRA